MRADPVYTGRATVPVLWDKQNQTIVNSESADIVRMLNGSFGKLSGNAVDLYPPDLAAEDRSAQ
jgi:putative glutathione S-transferase